MRLLAGTYDAPHTHTPMRALSTCGWVDGIKKVTHWRFAVPFVCLPLVETAWVMAGSNLAPLMQCRSSARLAVGGDGVGDGGGVAPAREAAARDLGDVEVVQVGGVVEEDVAAPAWRAPRQSP